MSCEGGTWKTTQPELPTREIALALWTALPRFRGDSSERTWLYRVARNLYIDHVRKEPHWLPIQDGLDRIDLGESDRRESQPESSFDQDLLKQAIDRLPPVQARLVRMCYLESKSHSEISRELEMPLGSVKSSLRRSFAKLQTSMRAAR